MVFETPEANCSKFMQSLCTAYSVYYNLRHGRHGHLLDGRFKARLVEAMIILTDIFSVEVDEFKRRRHNSPLRGVADRSLMRHAGLSQRDVADLLKVGSGAAVCNQIYRLPEKLANDRRLRRQLDQAEQAMSKAYRQRPEKTDGPGMESVL